MQCENCKKEIPDGSEFCSYCGAKQEETFFCYKCGSKIPTDSEFCQYCGTPQPTRKVQEEKTKTSNKLTNNKRFQIIIIIAAILVVTIIIIVLTKPFENKTAKSDNTQKIEEEQMSDEIASLKAESEFLSIAEYKNEFFKKDNINKNWHIQGYIFNDVERAGEGFRITAEKPAAYNPMTTPSAHLELAPNGISNKPLSRGDYVDVYFIVTGDVDILAYYIEVR